MVDAADAEAKRYLLDPTGRPYYNMLRKDIKTLPKPEATIVGRALGAEQYFDREATASRVRYLVFNLTQIICAGAITVVATLNGLFKVYANEWPIVTAVLGAAIAILRGFDGILPSRDTWLRTRATQQKLLSERIAYASKTGIYGTSSNALDDYRTRIEAILGGELQDWVTAAKPNSQAASPGHGSASRTP